MRALARARRLAHKFARMNVLVVEDEIALARPIVAALRRQGHDVSACHDGAAAPRTILQLNPDLVVLDLNLPGRDGLEVLAQIRSARCACRVLILTARGQVEDRITGLRAGADDYLPKPFAMEELVARCEALGRRPAAPAADGRLACADLQVDAVQRRVVRAGEPIELTPREFELLHIFVAEPGRVFSRGELSERVWQRDHRYDTRTVEIFIARLRRKLDRPGLTPLLHTVRGAGYVLQPDAPHE